MGEFMIECTLCGISFGSENQYEAHPCMHEDVKCPISIKMEPDAEEAELEEEVQKVLYDTSEFSCKEEVLDGLKIKDEPLDIDVEEMDPLGMSQEEEKGILEEAVDKVEETESLSAQAQDTPETEASEETPGSSLNECLVCGKRFFRREDFLNHKMNSHKVPRPYECTVCKKRFTQKHYVTLHMRVHTGERPYKCRLCSNTYTHKTSYTIHMRIHNGDRPYRCGLCGKRCYDKSGLTSHMRSHTKETPYECEVCGRRFTHSKSLMVHRRNHTGEKPYKCKYCEKSFRHWHKHKIHIRLHTGERPYRCKVCGKGFPRNDEVKRHMRSHQGIKAFKCSICSVYCATQASITGHIDLHHSHLKPDNPSAPEKTLVKNSTSGTLGTKAPQPRTIYKPIAALQNGDGSKEATATIAITTTTAERAVIAGKKGSDGKVKALSYKEYLEFQEKMLTNKGMKVKDPKAVTLPQTSAASVSSVVGNNNTFTMNNGKQIMILSSQGMQSHGGLQLALPNQGAVTSQVTSGANAVSQVAGQQLILTQPTINLPQAQAAQPTITLSPSQIPHQAITLPQQQVIQPSITLPQPQVMGGQVLGNQQLILLSPTGNQMNGMGMTQPILLLTGGNGGSGGQRLVLMPKQASGGGQMLLLPNNVSGGTNSAVSQVASTTNVQIKQEPVDNEVNVVNSVIKQEPGLQLPTSLALKQVSRGGKIMLLPNKISGSVSTGKSQLSGPGIQIKQEPGEPEPVTRKENMMKAVVIKQEPGVQIPTGIVIKQEPEEESPVLSSDMIKTEPQDTYE